MEPKAPRASSPNPTANLVGTMEGRPGKRREAIRGVCIFLPSRILREVISDLTEFEQKIGYAFDDRDLLTRALTHKSYSHEAKTDRVRHNETFEFLGDS